MNFSWYLERKPAREIQPRENVSHDAGSRLKCLPRCWSASRHAQKTPRAQCVAYKYQENHREKSALNGHAKTWTSSVHSTVAQWAPHCLGPPVLCSSVSLLAYLFMYIRDGGALKRRLCLRGVCSSRSRFFFYISFFFSFFNGRISAKSLPSSAPLSRRWLKSLISLFILI